MPTIHFKSNKTFFFFLFYSSHLHPKTRSNPGTPTQPRRPDFIGVNMVGQQQQQQLQQQQPGATYYDFPLQQQAQLHQTGLPPVHPYHQQQQQQQSQYPMVHHNGGLPQQQQQQQQQSQQRTPNVVYHHGSPQRRYLSEGELARQGAELSYARSNQTVDNIRELAGSPQRGVYMWKDMSPGFSNDGSNQTQQLLGNLQQQPQQSPGVFVSMAAPSVYQNTPSPTAAQQQQQQQQPQYGGVSAARYQLQQQQQQATMNSYHPALRGGVPVFPPQPLPPTAVSISTGNNQQQSAQVGNSIGGPQAPSPQIKRKATPTRPMSFVRALEMTDSMELNPTDSGSNNGGAGGGGGGGGSSSGGQSSGGRATTPTPPDRGSVYDMNYEISV